MMYLLEWRVEWLIESTNFFCDLNMMYPPEN